MHAGVTPPLLDEETKNELIKRGHDQALASFIKKASTKYGFRFSVSMSCVCTANCSQGVEPHTAPVTPSAPPPY